MGNVKALLLLIIAALLLSPALAQADDGISLTLTGSRVTESLTPEGDSDLLDRGGLATYSIIVENAHPQARAVDAFVTLPPGQAYVPGSLRINGLAAEVPTLADGAQIAWLGLNVPPAQPDAARNMAGVHIFLTKQPTTEEIDRRLAWAERLVGPGGTVKLFLSSITERWTAPPDWLVYAVRRSYALGMRPVIRLNFANGDASSFTRRHDDPVGQMSRSDAADGYWRIGWAARHIVAGLLEASAEAAAAAPSAELTVILGNEANIEWVERDWFIDYSYVRRPDGSFDGNWLTTDPADPTAAANSPVGWKRFVRGVPSAEQPAPNYDTRLDEYRFYLGYDAAVEYGRFLLTTSGLLRDLGNPRLRIAAGAVASGGGDLEGRYAYHQRHFIRRMLQTLPDALTHIDLWTTNNYPYTIPPWDNYHANPADFERFPLGEPFWHTEIGIDAYRGDLDYLAYLQRRGLATTVPSRAMIGEVGYGIGGNWGTAFGGPPITEDLRAAYMATIFEDYYNGWRDELASVNLWQLGDPNLADDAYHMFDFVYPDSQTAQGWPTHRHLVYDAVAARRSRPGPGRLIITFQARIDAQAAPGPVTAHAAINPTRQSTGYQLRVRPAR